MHKMNNMRTQIKLQNEWKKDAYKRMVSEYGVAEIYDEKKFNTFFNRPISYLHSNTSQSGMRDLYSDESKDTLSGYFKINYRYASRASGDKRKKNAIHALAKEYDEKFSKSRTGQVSYSKQPVGILNCLI